MLTKQKNNITKYLVLSIILAILLCFTQILGNKVLILLVLALYMILIYLACSSDYALPILLFFLPWSPLMRMNPNSFSFYTFGLILVCGISFVKRKFLFKNYALGIGFILLAITLLAKLVNGYSLSFDYIAFMFLLILFPNVIQELHEHKYSFYDMVVFFSLGIIIAALMAQNFADFGNIRNFIRVDSYTTITRKCGFYGDPNFYVAQITAAISGCLLLIINVSKKKQVFMLSVLTFILVYCGFLSGSKSFILITSAILAIWLYKIFRLKKRKIFKISIVVVLIFTVIYILSSPVFAELIDVLITRFSNSASLSDFTTHRTEIWVDYLEKILSEWNNVLIGNGFTNVKVNGRGSHNTIIQLMWQFGIIGILFLICWEYFQFKDFSKMINLKRLETSNIIILFFGVFFPWFAIDIMFFDEFYLMTIYFMCGIRLLGIMD